ncbi:class I SAM-dependent methyltransferase [Roseixanthobacter glucoisosaccharinicivorans]|uniref:class I SAM-dependent methyltransferase n=1 Tax=Roseixanthobacter glucoisosaccharinicivorans TaxID=3119923 RepID=UPI0037272F4C
MDRSQKLLHGIDKSMRILEIGPLFRPVCSREDGWNVYSIDHASEQELREKYRNHVDVDVSRIERVDFIWRGGSMADAIPKVYHGTFDACIASHVLEHIPDPIAFLSSLAVLLKPGAVVALAVPDKRWCFDFFRPLSTTAGWLEANRLGLTKHSRATRFEYETSVVNSDGRVAWGPGPLGTPGFSGCPIWQSYTVFRPQSDLENEDYVDCHAWCFTPSSFVLIIEELHALGAVDFRIKHTFPTVGHEFFIGLEQSRERETDVARMQKRRMRLMLATAHEVREQLEMLPVHVDLD